MFSGKNVTIQLKNHKTPNNWGNLVILYWLKLKLFCPIRSLKKLKGVLIRGGHATDGLTLTQRNFLKIVKSMLAEVGVFAGGISGKSFRSGIPSELEVFPEDFKERHLKALSRWKSSAYQIYIRKEVPERRRTFKAIFSVLIKISLRRKPKRSNRGGEADRGLGRRRILVDHFGLQLRRRRRVSSQEES